MIGFDSESPRQDQIGGASLSRCSSRRCDRKMGAGRKIESESSSLRSSSDCCRSSASLSSVRESMTNHLVGPIDGQDMVRFLYEIKRAEANAFQRRRLVE